MKSIEINKGTGAVVQDSRTVVIQQTAWDGKSIMSVYLTKDEILALAAQLQEADVEVAEEDVTVVATPVEAPPERYEMSVLMAPNKPSMKSILEGKEPKKRWNFLGWYPIPNLENVKHYHKGDYLIVESINHKGEVEKERYKVK